MQSVKTSKLSTQQFEAISKAKQDKIKGGSGSIQNIQP